MTMSILFNAWQATDSWPRRPGSSFVWVRPDSWIAGRRHENGGRADPEAPHLSERSAPTRPPDQHFSPGGTKRAFQEHLFRQASHRCLYGSMWTWFGGFRHRVWRQRAGPPSPSTGSHYLLSRQKRPHCGLLKSLPPFWGHSSQRLRARCPFLRHHSLCSASSSPHELSPAPALCPPTPIACYASQHYGSQEAFMYPQCGPMCAPTQSQGS